MGKKTGPNPTDRGKLGTKRSVVTDARGVPVGFAVDGANVPDYKLLEETLDAMPVKPPETLAGQPLNLCLDKGYDYDGPRQIAYDYNLMAHIPQPSPHFFLCFFNSLAHSAKFSCGDVRLCNHVNLAVLRGRRCPSHVTPTCRSICQGYQSKK